MKEKKFSKMVDFRSIFVNSPLVITEKGKMKKTENHNLERERLDGASNLSERGAILTTKYIIEVELNDALGVNQDVFADKIVTSAIVKSMYKYDFKAIVSWTVKKA